VKAIILAAGKGSRIKAVSGDTPKSLLPLGDSTLIGSSLRSLWAEGIRDIVVVTGFKRDKVSQYVRENWSGNVEFVFNPHFDTTNVLYSFWLGMPYLGDTDFVFLHADTVFEQQVLHQLLQHQSDDPIAFAVDHHECEEEEMKVKIKDGKVVQVTKQMDAKTCDGEFLGLAVVRGAQETIRREAEILFEEEAFQSFFEMAVDRLISVGDLTVSYEDVSGMQWREVDFEEDYEAARAMAAALTASHE